MCFSWMTIMTNPPRSDDDGQTGARAAPQPTGYALRRSALRQIRFVRGDTTILDGVDLEVRPGERWLLLGPNGCGKTSLLRIAALYEHPTAGVVEVLGERLGETDVRQLRRRIGFVSAALADQLRPTLSAFDAVRTARYGALEPWWHRYTTVDDERALECLERMGVGRLAEHSLVTLSSGERSRVLLARSLMNEPAVVLARRAVVGARPRRARATRRSPRPPRARTPALPRSSSSPTTSRTSRRR